jgi:hypothetical protein
MTGGHMADHGWADVAPHQWPSRVHHFELHHVHWCDSFISHIKWTDKLKRTRSGKNCRVCFSIFVLKKAKVGKKIPCPYYYEDYDVMSLCVHLEEDHPYEPHLAVSHHDVSPLARWLVVLNCQPLMCCTELSMSLLVISPNLAGGEWCRLCRGWSWELCLLP